MRTAFAAYIFVVASLLASRPTLSQSALPPASGGGPPYSGGTITSCQTVNDGAGADASYCEDGVDYDSASDVTWTCTNAGAGYCYLASNRLIADVTVAGAARYGLRLANSGAGGGEFSIANYAYSNDGWYNFLRAYAHKGSGASAAEWAGLVIAAEPAEDDANDVALLITTKLSGTASALVNAYQLAMRSATDTTTQWSFAVDNTFGLRNDHPTRNGGRLLLSDPQGVDVSGGMKVSNQTWINNVSQAALYISNTQHPGGVTPGHCGAGEALCIRTSDPQMIGLLNSAYASGADFGWAIGQAGSGDGDFEIAKNGSGIYWQLSTSGVFTRNSGVTYSTVADGASAVAHTLGTTSTFSTAGARLLEVENNGTVKIYGNKDGGLWLATVTSLDTCDATTVGLEVMYNNGANVISKCVCEQTGAATYAWGAATAAGSC